MGLGVLGPLAKWCWICTMQSCHIVNTQLRQGGTPQPHLGRLPSSGYRKHLPRAQYRAEGFKRGFSRRCRVVRLKSCELEMVGVVESGDHSPSPDFGPTPCGSRLLWTEADGPSGLKCGKCVRISIGLVICVSGNPGHRDRYPNGGRSQSRCNLSAGFGLHYTLTLTHQAPHDLPGACLEVMVANIDTSCLPSF
jgi:hypothetical protein